MLVLNDYLKHPRSLDHKFRRGITFIHLTSSSSNFVLLSLEAPSVYWEFATVLRKSLFSVAPNPVTLKTQHKSFLGEIFIVNLHKYFFTFIYVFFSIFSSTFSLSPFCFCQAENFEHCPPRAHTYRKAYHRSLSTNISMRYWTLLRGFYLRP